MAVRNGGSRLRRQVRNDILRSNSRHKRKKRINIYGLLRLLTMGPHNLLDLGDLWLRTSLYQGRQRSVMDDCQYCLYFDLMQAI